jgi:hypothetical protein
MATLETPEANILEGDAVNWRLIVYPLAAVMILLIGGFGIYSYVLTQREAHEASARQAMLAAQTPPVLVQVADQFPGTTHGALALLAAADLSFGQKDYASAEKDDQRVVADSSIDASLRDSARLGLAAAFEADGKSNDQALSAYLEVAHRGKSSPYAPYAYLAAARLYDLKHDRENERQILTEASSLGGASVFVKEAQNKLQAMNLTASPANSLAPFSTPPTH